MGAGAVEGAGELVCFPPRRNPVRHQQNKSRNKEAAAQYAEDTGPFIPSVGYPTRAADNEKRHTDQHKGRARHANEPTAWHAAQSGF